MTKGLERLSEKDYPGRVIIIGTEKSGKNVVVLYAITGRSPSSQARKIEFSDHKFQVKLLIYPAILLSEGIIVSNGRQTDDIQAAARGAGNAVYVLESSLTNWEYEPDVPTFTPRISGCILPSKNAALSLIKRKGDGSTQREYFEIPLIPGQGKMISTYAGENKDPLPSYTGLPEDVFLSESSAEDMAAAVYEAMKPKEGKHSDFRVSVACVYGDPIDNRQYTLSIVNRSERGT